MSATDELRRLLDERGVEWFESVTRKGLTWIYRDGKAIRFHPWQPDTLKVSMFDLTPEQAIDATLGTPRTTRAIIVSDKSTDCATGHCECELCGEPIDPWDKYCRHCGARIEVDE